MMLNCPRFERPREKAICNGIETLSNQELIAVILRTGNKEMSVLFFLLDTVFFVETFDTSICLSESLTPCVEWVCI